ncbi:hypothetical protein [Bacteroides caecimuris]|uniref:hypothetical protein n=1 Tax=Bacteroides caecimuris TaxID=1796613 RepID=UPI0026E57BDF|nr:hypothetical protein [Bacteroides caecimuris]
MKKTLFVPFSILTAIFMTLNILAFGSELDSLVGRPFKDFSTTAFCSYSSYHPSQYLTDNNWDILCAFLTPGTTAKLDSLGVSHSKSQLRLLEVGDLLLFEKGVYHTKMPIFGSTQTQNIRKESKEFADSIFPLIEPDIKDLIAEFSDRGYATQNYSLIFSYLLDGYIWGDDKLISPSEMTEHGTWSGAYWAMYNNRAQDKIGTNEYGTVNVNWSGELGYWPGDKLLIKFANCIGENQLVIENEDIKVTLEKWNLVDKEGHVSVPVIYSGNGDKIDNLCDKITKVIAEAVKKHCISFANEYHIGSQEEAEVIFYHEVMWDLLSILEDTHLIEKPAILKGEEVGKEHFKDITFIVISNE